MKFYNFSSEVFQWDVILNSNQFSEVVGAIKKEQFIPIQELPLKFELIDSYEDLSEWDGETPFMDIIRWSSDFTLGGNCPEKGGAGVIISEKVKKILEKYQLPPHRFYNIHMYCAYNKETRKDYYLFHIAGGKAGREDSVMDYNKCTFKELSEDEEGNRIVVNKFPEGTINTREEYVEACLGQGNIITLGSYPDLERPGKVIRNDLRFINRVFKHNVDVLWGVFNVIKISEEIKEELEKENIKGASFFELPENMIRPFEYEQMKNS
ncbi:hypothetical protein [uncultured Tenacibaculum sp.]|uniref:hypothetical protein n=1 Tax=uncultured Tenacibaculum sp. TaxID=174713 RepID=UPI00261E8A08|nr:hypothetical protein [uncultured Tenacibaculum sp.]